MNITLSQDDIAAAVLTFLKERGLRPVGRSSMIKFLARDECVEGITVDDVEQIDQTEDKNEKRVEA